jgi:hypothetical protein
MMDCSHSMAGEDTVGQTGGFSYATPEKKYQLKTLICCVNWTPYFATHRS